MEQIERYVRARVPLIQLVTHEETRALQYLAEVSRRMMVTKGEGKPADFKVWSMTRGLYEPLNVHTSGSSQGKMKKEPEQLDPMEVISSVVEEKKPALYVFLDYHPYMSEENPSVRRALRDMVQAIRGRNVSVVLLQPMRLIPEELEKDMAYVELPLPNVKQLEARLMGAVKKLQKTSYTVSVEAADVEAIVQAGQGLTRDEFDKALSMSLAENGCLDQRTVTLVSEEKRAVIKKQGILEYIEVKTGMDEIGGLEELKSWAQKRRRAFSNEAREFGLPQPKGCLLLGIQGCGKSAAAKAISASWNIPLVRLDVGALFGGLVGESEANTRKALAQVEAVSPCVLWIDEIEKSMAGMGGGGDSDSGTTQRVFSTILTWMNDKTAPVFVVATANRVMQLPPELLRKGRFDELFFVDLPTKRERFSILDIHLRKRARNPEEFNREEVVEATKDFSGAEIEQVVVAGLFDAFEEDRALETGDLVKAAQTTVPLSTTMREVVEALRDWCENRAVRASLPEEVEDEAISDIGQAFVGMQGGFEA